MIELLLAGMIMALLMGGAAAQWHSALRLQHRAADRRDVMEADQAAAECLRRDLANAAALSSEGTTEAQWSSRAMQFVTAIPVPGAGQREPRLWRVGYAVEDVAGRGRVVVRRLAPDDDAELLRSGPVQSSLFDHVDTFHIQYAGWSAGRLRWEAVWPEASCLPRLVEVTVTRRGDVGSLPPSRWVLPIPSGCLGSEAG